MKAKDADPAYKNEGSGSYLFQQWIQILIMKAKDKDPAY